MLFVEQLRAGLKSAKRDRIYMKSISLDSALDYLVSTKNYKIVIAILFLLYPDKHA
jgi:hypothetical protein